jgi:hypothetical protein
MNSQFQAVAESKLDLVQASGVLEMTLTGLGLLVDKEEALGQAMNQGCGKNMGETDPHPPLLPVDPSSTETNGKYSIKV